MCLRLWAGGMSLYDVDPIPFASMGLCVHEAMRRDLESQK